MRGVLFRVSELNTAQNARHTVESPPPIGENARCFIPCVRIKHRAGCPRHSWVTAPYRGEEIHISLHWNITFETDRNLSSFSHICVRMEHRATCPSVRIKHRAGCPRHSWVTAPYRGEEIQIWWHGNITFETLTQKHCNKLIFLSVSKVIFPCNHICIPSPL